MVKKNRIQQFTPCKDDSHSLLCTEYRFGKVRIHAKTLNPIHDYDGSGEMWVRMLPKGVATILYRTTGLLWP